MAGLELIIVLLAIALFALSFYFRKTRLRAFYCIASIADAFGLTLRRSRSGLQNEPEAYGTVGGRPVLARFDFGGKTTPEKVIISVGHRFPVAGLVWVFASEKASRAYGSKRQKRHPLSDDPAGPVLTGTDGIVVQAFFESLSPQAAALIVSWTRLPAFYHVTMDDDDIRIEFTPKDGTIENGPALLAELAAVAADLEAQVSLEGIAFDRIDAPLAARLGNIVMIGLSLLMFVAGIAALPSGWPALFAVFMGGAFLNMFTLSRKELRLIAQSKAKRRDGVRTQ